jgi:hypothetical protein
MKTTPRLTKFESEQIETIIKHKVDVAVEIATCLVRVIPAKKYAEITGENLQKVNKWCADGVLKCDCIVASGEIIADWKELPISKVRWWVDLDGHTGIDLQG